MVVEILNIGLLLLLVITAVAVVVVRDLLIATILMTIYSLLMAGVYLVLGAPDVAITEAAIGAGISTVLFLAAVLLVGREEQPPVKPLLPFLVVVVTGVALFYAVAGLPDLGDSGAASSAIVSPYYLERSEGEMGIPNVVTSVLASYRGFDTMGEVFVVFTAAISVLLLLGGDKKPARASKAKK